MKQTIVLKKDKTEKFLVKYGEIKKEFRFNWTLYQNNGLVVKANYDRFNSQHVLYMNHVNQSIRIELRPISMQRRWLPYIIVTFVKFDTKTQEATFDLFLFDKKEQVEFTQPNKETPKA
ncbi:MAG: hypothetical protein PHX13_11855 [Thiovulaceae bacterium]|nr:hypothetical protein [Sulfurimonadaceae bacterium]